MFCISCGANNSDEAVYCLKCGKRLEAEDETVVRVKPDADGDDANVVFSITPTLFFIKIGYVAAAVCAILLAALISILFPSVPFIVVVIIALAVFLVPAFYHLRKRMTRYTLTDSTFQLDRGFISRTTQNLPLRRVQDITVSSSVFQRMFGLGNIEIDNSGEFGDRVVLANVNSPRKYADIVLKEIRRLDK